MKILQNCVSFEVYTKEEYSNQCIMNSKSEVEKCGSSLKWDNLKGGDVCSINYNELIPCVKSALKKCPSSEHHIKLADLVADFFNQECS